MVRTRLYKSGYYYVFVMLQRVQCKALNTFNDKLLEFILSLTWEIFQSLKETQLSSSILATFKYTLLPAVYRILCLEMVYKLACLESIKTHTAGAIAQWENGLPNWHV